MTRIPVLDKGYVELVDHMGTDLSVANAARASFMKRSIEFDEKDARLVRFLAREDHSSPFRHAMVQFEVKAPLMVARQWWKYVVGSDHTMDGWNEASRRYVTLEPEFYIPSEWRSAPENKKQGSGDPIDPENALHVTEAFTETISACYEGYEYAMRSGVAAEQARLFLPAYAMYTNWWWTVSVQGVMHFLKQRLEDDAQKEIRDYARAIAVLVQPLFPTTFEELVGGGE